MANTTPVKLHGGPCDGETVQATPAELTAHKLTCKGTVYDLRLLRQVGWIGTAETASGGPPQKGGTPHTHKGWADLQRSFNTHLPHQLEESHRLTSSALRSLSKARKVRF